MIMSLKAEQTFLFRGAPVTEIAGYDNGCFTLTTRGKRGALKQYGFSYRGEVLHEFQGKNGLEVVMMNDGYYLRVEYGKGYHAGVLNPVKTATLFDEAGHEVASGIYGFRLFTNNWYILCFGAARVLFNNKHEKVADWFGRCIAFGDGYYATQSDWLITSLEHCWQLYKQGERVGQIVDVEDFLGNSCLLIRHYDKTSRLTDLEGNELCRLPVIGYKKLLNNRFVLTFEDGTRRLYRPDGSPLGVAVKDVVLLADGRFVTKDRHLLTGLYGKDGIIEKDVPVPTAVNDFSYYYILKWFDKSVLYDGNGQNLGEGYELIAAKDNFLLAERAGRVCLFNQYGCALVCDK